MYTLVMMSALSAAPSGPGFNGYFQDLFSSGGCCGSCSGCCGSCYGSCSGTTRAGSTSCSGCCGGGCCGGWVPGSRIRAFFARQSCYGSCSGRSLACYGSCCGGCCGGGSGYPMPVPMGDGYPAPGPAPAPYSTPPPYSPPAPPVDDGGVPPAVPRPAPPPGDMSAAPSGRVGFAAGGSGRATVVVRLPADARLLAEGRPLPLTSGEREFVSPPLPPGQDFLYTFRAEYVRDGETISQTRRVAIRAGAVAAVEFTDLTARRPDAGRTDAPAKTTAVAPSAAVGTVVPPPPANGLPTPNPFTVPPRQAPAAGSDRARLTVRVPAGVTLYVDGTRNDRTDPVREFNTPPLPAGQEFAYLMKAERVRDGRPETQTQRVTFRAGEIVSVDFTTWPR